VTEAAAKSDSDDLSDSSQSPAAKPSREKSRDVKASNFDLGLDDALWNSVSAQIAEQSRLVQEVRKPHRCSKVLRLFSLPWHLTARVIICA